MVIGICYLILGFNMLFLSRSKNITNNHHIKSIGKTFIVIAIINIFCFILAIIFKNENIELIGKSSVIYLGYFLYKLFNRMKLEQDAKELIDKLSDE